MSKRVLRPALAVLGTAILAACSSLPEPQPVAAAPDTRLARGEMVDGTIYVRNIRGRILFTGLSKEYRFGREIRIHPYDSNGVLDVSIHKDNWSLFAKR